MTAGGNLVHLRGAAGMAAIYRKISWHLLPLLILCYIVAYLDRVNISYAQLQMEQSLEFGEQVYGWGAGLFFIAYLLFEVPSNLMLEKVGVRKTLLRIMLCWGVVAATGAFVSTPWQFYAMRFALGMFEAGFFPGVILYLTYWYPAARRAKVVALFGSAVMVASAMAGPLCGAILHYLDHWRGLAGWQWMFIIQGLPAVLLGIVAYACLPDDPSDADWLTPGEHVLMRQEMQRELALRPPATRSGMAALLQDPVLYLLALANFLLVAASYALVLWVPTLMQSWGMRDLMELGLYSSLPYIAGIVGMLAIGRHSDWRRERRWHFAACMFSAALGLGIVVAAHNGLMLSLAGLSLALAGIAAATPLFMTILTEYLEPAQAAAGIALLSSCGILGGAFSPVVSGAMLANGATTQVLGLLITLCLLAGMTLLLALRKSPIYGDISEKHYSADNAAQS
ncbi:MFS transporter [Oxalobacteraceae bacterium]|nr:MFS transporter [Oxalobacteraceae bacterium]